MSIQLKLLISSLKQPSVILSIASRIISVMLLLGFQVNQSVVLAVVTACCSIMVTPGIMSNPDSTKKGYGDDLLTCSNSGKKELHTRINGQMVCTVCGAVYDPSKETDVTDSESAS